MPGQNTRSFTERVALVTGGARGIGRAVALQLALEGAYVIVGYAPADTEGERVTRELRELGTLAHAFEADVSQAGDIRHLFRMVEETYGRLDLLVNTAHIMRADTPFDEVTEDAWNEVVNLTLKGTFLCAQQAARLMRRRPSPAIVNIVSEAGLTGCRGGVPSVAAHAGVIGLTKALARELAPRVRVNCVAVGGRAEAEESEGQGAREEAENRFGAEAARSSGTPSAPAPDEVARACVYLLSADAGSITGQTLVVGAIV